MTQVATIKKVSVVIDKDNQLLASVLLTFPVATLQDKESLFELIRMQNEEVEFECVPQQVSLLEKGNGNEHGYKD
jgi:hypothetical protein